MICGKEKVVKMIDLGLAATKTHSACTSVMGTYRYMAPEVFFSDNYDKAVDLWSLGVAFYTMLTLDVLLPDEEDQVKKLLAKPKHVENKVKSCKVLKQRKLSKSARDFLNKCLVYDAKDRLTVDEALQHSFIVSSGQKPLPGALSLPKQKFTKTNLAKMEGFAAASPLKRIALLAIAHTISQRPDNDLIEVRLLFRDLNKNGNGKLSILEIEDALKQDALTAPPNLKEVFRACCSSDGGALSFNEFIACNLPDAYLTEQLCTTVFRLLDRDGNGTLNPDDFTTIATFASLSAKFSRDIVFESTGKPSITSAEFCNHVLG